MSGNIEEKYNLAGLDDADLLGLSQAVAAETTRRDKESIIEQVLASLDEADEVNEMLLAHGSVEQVLFVTTEFGNGYFYSPNAELTFTDGTVLEDFDLADAEDALSDMTVDLGPLGMHDKLILNLRERTVEQETRPS